MTLSLYNTLTGRVEPFAPEDPPTVRIYVCGLTVYGRGHIGNYRTFVATDLLRRTLNYKGWEVRDVMNITDVDDRIIRLAAEAGATFGPFTAPHIPSFDEDMAALHGAARGHASRHRHIAEMVDLVSRLDRARPYLHVRGQRVLPHLPFPEYGRLRGSTRPASRRAPVSTPTSTTRRMLAISRSGRAPR